MRLRNPLLITVLFLGGITAPLHAQITLTQRVIKIEPKARQVLDRVTDAYRKVSNLLLKTEFYSEMIPLDSNGNVVKIELPIEKSETAPPDKTAPDKNSARQKVPRSLQLAFSRPNRIRLEMTDATNEMQPYLYQWVSDGKYFYSTIPEKNYFTKEKAPRSFTDFFYLRHMNFTSWDILLLVGVDVFAEFLNMMDSVTIEGTESIRGVQTDIVKMEWASPYQEIVYRFYVGREDSLLRRVTQETRDTTAGNEPGKVGGGDPFDQLSDVVQPSNPVSIPLDEREVPLLPPPTEVKVPKSFKTRMTYEYSVDVRSEIAAGTFEFTPPVGALLSAEIPHKRLKVKDYRAMAKAILARRKN